MAIKVGINGFGRIGRNVVRAGLNNPEIEFVAANDLTDTKTLAHLLKYDSILGQLQDDVKAEGDSIIVGGKKIKIFATKDPAEIDWPSLGAQVVVESTGRFTDADGRQEASARLREESHHLRAGQGRRRHHRARRERRHVRCREAQRHLERFLHHQLPGAGGESAAREVRHRERLDDDDPQLHQRSERSRFPAQGSAPRPRRRLNMIPTSTGAAKAIGLVMPELKGKLDGYSMRVPTPDVSVVDFVAVLKKNTTTEEVNAALKKAAEGPLKGILAYTDDPVVSTDMLHNPNSSIVDSRADQGAGRQSGEGRRLVRQRVGLLEPRGRPDRVPRQKGL